MMNKRIQEALLNIAGKGYKMELLRQDGNAFTFHNFEPAIQSAYGGKLVSVQMTISPDAQGDPDYDLEGDLIGLWSEDSRR